MKATVWRIVLVVAIVAMALATAAALASRRAAIRDRSALSAGVEEAFDRAATIPSNEAAVKVFTQADAIAVWSSGGPATTVAMYDLPAARFRYIPVAVFCSRDLATGAISPVSDDTAKKLRISWFMQNLLESDRVQRVDDGAGGLASGVHWHRGRSGWAADGGVFSGVLDISGYQQPLKAIAAISFDASAAARDGEEIGMAIVFIDRDDK